MGSKARIAKELSHIINKLIVDNNINTYVEPFVGGANLIEHIRCLTKFGFDNNKYLIALLKAIKQGWKPLETVQMTKELYQDIKDNKDKYPLEMVALAGFCATYNAKWFGGFAGVVKTKIGTYRNYYEEAVKNIMKQAPRLADVIFSCADFSTLDFEGALIYCDPPYKGTTGYKDKFNHEAYWEWVRKMSQKNIVLCSEYEAPADFECIWQSTLTTTLDKSSRSKAVEKLFIYKK